MQSSRDKTKRLQQTALALTTLLSAGAAAHAGTFTKDNNTNALTNAASYTANSGTPTAADTVLIDSTVLTPLTFSSGSGLFVGALQLTNPGGAQTLTVNSGGSPTTLTIGTGTTPNTAIDMSAATQDFSILNGTASVSTLRLASLSGTRTFTVATGRTLTIGTALTVQGNTETLALTGGGSVVLNGVVSNGTGVLVLNVSGANATLANANTYTGATTLSSGALNVNNAAAVSTGTLTLNGGTLDNTSGAAITNTNNNAITLGGSFAFGGTNALNLGTGTVTDGGNRTITLGGTGSTLTFGGQLINSSNNIQTTTVNGAGSTVTFGGYALSNNATSRIDTLNGTGNITITGPIVNGGTSTAGGLIYSGTGTLTLSGANTYSGATTLSSGTLNLANANALQFTTLTESGAANSLTFAPGIGTFNVGGLAGGGFFTLADTSNAPVALSVGGNNAATTYSGVMSGSGSLAKVGTGALTLSGANTYSGGTSISGGQITLSSSGNTSASIGSGAVSLSSGGILRLNSTSGNTVDNALGVGTGTGTLSFRGNSTFAPSAVTGTLTLQIDNGITVTPNTFAGDTGMVAVRTGGTAATLRLGATYVNNSLVGGVLDLGAGISETRNAGTNATVTTDIGTLVGAAGSSLGGSLAGNGTFVYSIGARNENSTFAGTVVDGGTKTGLAKVGTGTLILTGANTNSGTTTITAGELRLDNAAGSGTGTGLVNETGGVLSGTGNVAGLLTVTNGAVLAAGDNTSANVGTVGTLSVGTTGGATLTSAALDFDFSASALSGNDLLTMGSTLGLGTLSFTFNELTGALDTTNPYTLISGAAGVSGFTGGYATTFLNAGAGPAYTATYSVDGNNNLLVSFSDPAAAPEPSQWVALLVGTLGLGGLSLKARRRQAA